MHLKTRLQRLEKKIHEQQIEFVPLAVLLRRDDGALMGRNKLGEDVFFESLTPDEKPQGRIIVLDNVGC